MQKLYVWKRGDRYYQGPGYTKDINKAEIHRNRTPVENTGKEREIEVMIVEVNRGE